jgi:uncharacterized membrane protein YtjA (UPF0391 family)
VRLSIGSIGYPAFSGSGEFRANDFTPTSQTTSIDSSQRVVLSPLGTFRHVRRSCYELNVPRRDGSHAQTGVLFLVISLVAGLLGFTGISIAAAGVARILFFVAIVIFLVFLVLGLMATNAAP